MQLNRQRFGSPLKDIPGLIIIADITHGQNHVPSSKVHVLHLCIYEILLELGLEV